MKRPENVTLKDYWEATSSIERTKIIEKAFIYIEELEAVTLTKQLDGLCKDWIAYTKKQDEGKWYDNRHADRVNQVCEWIQNFEKRYKKSYDIFSRNR